MDEGAKAVGKGVVVDEEVAGLFRVDELVVFGIVSDGRDDAVDVGVVLHLAAPGMEDGGDAEAEAGGFELGSGDVVEGGGAAL